MQVSYLAQHPNEVETIAQWYLDEWGQTIAGITLSEIKEKVAAKAQSQEEFPLALVVHEHDELVAVAELKLQENKNHPEFMHWLGGVYVAKSQRGKGYAHALINRAKQHVAHLGISKLYLQAEQHNVALYLNHGFKFVCKTEHNGVQTTVMVWESES
ncbi:GNAT family N-acetyltransferase (plasmid) [Pseudoalteromonas sp. T1lg65]|uniref:GNAT family N-acetyltransferase n=1 Tax=Pseudoalteromonas sp. T1lg65 TaxID=2077101 RepID=UPI003F7A705A